MAGPCTYQSLSQNPPPAGEDELARAALRAFTHDNGIPSYPLTVSRVSTPTLAPPLILAKFVAKYTDTDLQKATKLALKLFI